MSGALPDAHAVLYCDLYENDVVLAVSPWRWSVDALLERAEQDAKAAAALVASDYFAAAGVESGFKTVKAAWKTAWMPGVIESNDLPEGDGGGYAVV